MEYFQTVSLDDNGVFYTTYLGNRVRIEDVECFVFCDGDDKCPEWIVSHLKTGFRVAIADNCKDAISEATKNIKNDPSAIDRAIKKCAELGIKLPVNK